MLDLVNEARAEADLESVTLGDNPAAQAHAEAAIEGSFLSHWDLDGLKPSMRYSFAGGYQSNGEIIHRVVCEVNCQFDPEDLVADIMETWMTNNAKETILWPLYKKVNIGLSWERSGTAWAFVAVQQFEGDYLVLTTLPNIDAAGHLSFAGTAKNGARIANRTDLHARVYYDPLPSPLTLGQIQRVVGLSPSLYVAFLFRAPSTGYYWSDEPEPVENVGRKSPHDVPADAPIATTLEEQDVLRRLAIAEPLVKIVTIPHWIQARTWSVENGSFEIRADFRGVLNEYGPGVYRVMVWTKFDGEWGLLLSYAFPWNGRL